MSIETLQRTTSLGARAASALSAADEKRVARELSPRIAWPTLALAVALPLSLCTVTGLGLARIVPLWACAIVLSFLSYAHYTLVHEAIHGNLVPGHPKLRWVNDLVGWVGALGEGFNWPMLMRTHVLHHAHTNTEDDPDIWVKGGFVPLIAKALFANVVLASIPLFVVRYLAPNDYRQATSGLRGTEAAQADVVTTVVLLLLAFAIPTGHVMDWLFLLFIPTRIAGVLLAIYFQWLPHHPFDSTERYLNTRIGLWPGAGLMTLQQNLHLMHHLWPSVPFYNYGRLYRRLRPTLVAKGSRIEGLLVGAHAKDRSGA
jgi:fatty acid desaturase